MAGPTCHRVLQQPLKLPQARIAAKAAAAARFPSAAAAAPL